MKLVGGTVYALKIPFAEAFRHSSQDRAWSDAVVLRVVSDSGVEGFGEGLPRSYVTGESVEIMVRRIVEDLWPGVVGRELPAAGPHFDSIDEFIPNPAGGGVIAHNASRAAVELAVADCVYGGAGRSLGLAFPPVRPTVRYSGVITAGSVEQTRKIATQMRLIGLSAVKVKVGLGDDVGRLEAVREVLGPQASLRLDANGAWPPGDALARVAALERFGIDCVEQPIPRGAVVELQRFRAACSIPVMVDESLITMADAEVLIEARAADFFNVRISKCGGMAPSLRIATRALEAGIGVQVGCQVGETAILSSAGRHLAAALPSLAYAEGSFGTLLLAEDVSIDPVRFGHGGAGSLLKGPGLGIRVRTPVLEKYAVRQVELRCC